MDRPPDSPITPQKGIAFYGLIYETAEPREFHTALRLWKTSLSKGYNKEGFKYMNDKEEHFWGEGIKPIEFPKPKTYRCPKHGESTNRLTFWSGHMNEAARHYCITCYESFIANNVPLLEEL